MNIQQVIADGVTRQGTRISTFGLTPLVLSLFAFCVLLFPMNASAVPISTAEFKFVVPLTPQPPPPDEKTSPGGWGGLFVSFNILVNKATFSVNPVLADCVDEPSAPVKADDKFGAPPADSFLWKCRRGYLLNSATRPGLTVKLVAEFDTELGPAELLLDSLDDADPKRTFWFQKTGFNDDATVRFFRGSGDADPPKLAALPVPEPGTLSLLLGAIGALYASILRRRNRLAR